MDISFNQLVALVGVLVSLTVAIVNLHRLIYSVTGRQDEYKFAKGFFDDLANQRLTPFIEALGYKAIAGFKKAEPEAVKYLLETEGGMNHLYRYRKCWSKVEYQKVNSGFGFKGHFNKRWCREVYVGLWFLVYVLSASVAIAPFFFSEFIAKEHIELSLLLSVALAVVSIYALFEAISIKDAGKLVALKSESRRLVAEH